MTDISDDKLRGLLDNKLSRQDYDSVVETLGSESGREALSRQMDVVLNRLESEDVAGLCQKQRSQTLDRIRKKINKTIWFRRIGYVATLALMFAFGWLTSGVSDMRRDESKGSGEIVVAKGERPVHMVFQDGTQVVVNSGSLLRYPMGFDTGERIVYLKGEAYFNVKANADWPFRVEMDNASIKVSGTAFNARHYDTDSTTTVTLDNGSLALECAGKIFALKPAQKVVFNHVTNEGYIRNNGSASGRASLWKENIIAFDKAPADEVLNTINRLYDIEFKVLDNDVMTHTFTFTSAVVPLDSLLKDIETISYVKFRKKGNTVEVYSIR